MTNQRPGLRPLLLALGACASAAPGVAAALGLGGIEVKSALSQPFEAEIALLQDRPGEADLATVRLASAEAFERAGLDRRFFLTGFEFSVERRASGASYVRVSSSQPVREPFLEFLVEAAWPGGNLLRQYTVLLDPPGQPWAGAAAASPSTPPPSPAPAAQAAPQTESPTPPWPRVDQFAEVGEPHAGERYGPVRPGETLWAIAARARPAGASHAQAMAAILRANPEAFIGGDARRLMAGSTLVIPRAEELAAGDETGARAEMAPYVPGWGAVATAAEAPAAEEPPPAVPAQGPVEPAQANSGAAAEPEVRVVQAGAPSAGAADAAPTADQVLLIEETLDATRQENTALRERVEALESQVAALSQKLGVSAPDAVAQVAGGDAGQGGDKTAAALAGAAPQPAPEPDAPPADGAGRRPWGLAAAAVGLVGGLGILVARRRGRDGRAAAQEAAARAGSRAGRAAAAPTALIEVSAVGDKLPGTDSNASRLDLLAALVAARNTAGARDVYAEILASGDAAARAQADALMRGQQV